MEIENESNDVVESSMAAAGEETSWGRTTLGELLSAELEVAAAAANRGIVKGFYKALASNDAEAVARVVAPNLEWWFHGPPHRQHLMRLLTGVSSRMEFKFKPRRVAAVAGGRVIVEGWQGSVAYWVHVWTLDEKGMMTQLREYFDTWLTVIARVSSGDRDDDDDDHRYGIIRLWQSEPKKRFNRSLPDVVLPI